MESENTERPRFSKGQAVEYLNEDGAWCEAHVLEDEGGENVNLRFPKAVDKYFGLYSPEKVRECPSSRSPNSQFETVIKGDTIIFQMDDKEGQESMEVLQNDKHAAVFKLQGDRVVPYECVKDVVYRKESLELKTKSETVYFSRNKSVRLRMRKLRSARRTRAGKQTDKTEMDFIETSQEKNDNCSTCKDLSKSVDILKEACKNLEGIVVKQQKTFEALDTKLGQFDVIEKSCLLLENIVEKQQAMLKNLDWRLYKSEFVKSAIIRVENLVTNQQSTITALDVKFEQLADEIRQTVHDKDDHVKENSGGPPSMVVSLASDSSQEGQTKENSRPDPAKIHKSPTTQSSQHLHVATSLVPKASSASSLAKPESNLTKPSNTFKCQSSQAVSTSSQSQIDLPPSKQVSENAEASTSFDAPEDLDEEAIETAQTTKNSLDNQVKQNPPKSELQISMHLEDASTESDPSFENRGHYADEHIRERPIKRPRVSEPSSTSVAQPSAQLTSQPKGSSKDHKHYLSKPSEPTVQPNSSGDKNTHYRRESLKHQPHSSKSSCTTVRIPEHPHVHDEDDADYFRIWPKTSGVGASVPLPPAVLSRLESEGQDRNSFAKHALCQLFSIEEMEGKTVTGKGKKGNIGLNAEKLEYIRTLTFLKYPASSEEMENREWARVIKSFHPLLKYYTKSRKISQLLGQPLEPENKKSCCVCKTSSCI